MGRHDLPHDRQAEPGSLGAGRQANEGFEHLLSMLRRDARAVVGNLDRQIRRDAHRKGCGLAGMGDGVGHEIGDRAAQSGLVAADEHGFGRRVEGRLQAATDDRGRLVRDHPAGKLDEVDLPRRHLGRRSPHAGEVEHRRDQGGEPVEVGEEAAAQHGVADLVDLEAQDGERGAQLVGGVGDERRCCSMLAAMRSSATSRACVNGRSSAGTLAVPPSVPRGSSGAIAAAARTIWRMLPAIWRTDKAIAPAIRIAKAAATIRMVRPLSRR
jgi:hypothetical protein